MESPSHYFRVAHPLSFLPSSSCSLFSPSPSPSSLPSPVTYVCQTLHLYLPYNSPVLRVVCIGFAVIMYHMFHSGEEQPL